MSTLRRRLRRGFKHAGNALGGFVAVRMLKFMRLFRPDASANAAGWLMRTIGPFFPENRIGRANLKAAFPEKSDAEIETILTGVWDNVGRMGAEFAQLDRLWNADAHEHARGRVELGPEASERRQAGADLCGASG
jgi:KDO2-lipid IV(A) lauroyltransferase